jgi:hypothetical protein
LCATCDGVDDGANDGSISTTDASFETSIDARSSDGGRSDGGRGDGVGSDGIARDAGGAVDTALPPDVVPFDTMPPPPGCPPVLPKDGSPCDTTTECDYDGCDPTKSDRATCSGGAWMVKATACTSVCPPSLPVYGSPCTLPPRVACTWSVHCLDDAIGFCQDGKWGIKGPGTTCDRHDCPPTEPVDGTTCPPTSPGFGFSCFYTNACGHFDTWLCTGETWSAEVLQACSAPPSCPATPPTPASSCVGRLSCGYVNTCGTIDTYECGGDWIEWPGVCSTPACPTTPSDLDPCTLEGTTCRYPDGAGCELDCTCTSGKFECTQPPCGAH